MAIEEVIEEVVAEPVIDTTVTNPEPEIRFEDLTPSQQKYVDQERNKASKTAREKTRRDALTDPDIRKAISAELEAEATLTAEQKVERRLQEAYTIENRSLAREKLVENGIIGDDLTEILEMVVTPNAEATMAKVDKFVNIVKNRLKVEEAQRTRKSLLNTPVPHNAPTETKPFKEMSWDERSKLKDTDHARYLKEMDKLRTKI